MKRQNFTARLKEFAALGANGCWTWPGYKTPKGYGMVGATVRGVFKVRSVHRAAYELLIGPVPPGLTLDHLCRNRACFNPRHLEPVTAAENTRRGIHPPTAINARKTHCKYGHEFTPKNTRVEARGGRQCIACCRIRGMRYVKSRRGRLKAKHYASSHRDRILARQRRYYEEHKEDWKRRRAHQRVP